MFDEDEIPVAHLFREEDEMGELELKALGLSKGRILDVGAGAGCHALALQDKGMSVTAIDVSPLSVEVMAKSGVDDARLVNLYDDALCEKFDTILMFDVLEHEEDDEEFLKNTVWKVWMLILTRNAKMEISM